MANRVVITGLGVVSSAGGNVPEFWQNVLKGVSFVRKLSFYGYEKLPSKVGATISEAAIDSLKVLSHIPEYKLKTLSRSSLLALFAAHQAITESKLADCDTETKDRIGVAIGSGMPDLQDICDTNKKLDQSYNRISPYFIPRILLNMSAGNISIEYGFRGPNQCVSTACATGAHSIGDSFKLIQSGKAVAMICGGTESCINPLTVAGFGRLRALSCNFNHTPTVASRPFDQERDGFVIGEGAAVLVLEDLDHALSRNVDIYGEILGYGMSGDAYSLTTPSENGEGAILCMERCIDDAQVVTVDDISYVNAHATSTPIGDKTELDAVQYVFRDVKHSVYVSSLKGCFGHLLGAAGSVETVGTVLACYHGWLPPTANLRATDSKTGNVVCNREKIMWQGVSRRIALKNSFGFGGTNASLCVAEFQR